MDMRDGSLICVGKGNPDWNYSAPHGAGRLMSRKKAKEVLSMDDYINQMKDISSTSICESTIDENLPEFNSLNYRHFQLFMKRLRKEFAPNNIRFYMCGEYGEDFSRPHFHALLFNCFFSDRKRIPGGASGSPLYRSDTLERLWPYGFSCTTFSCSARALRAISGIASASDSISWMNSLRPVLFSVISPLAISSSSLVS